MTSHQASANVSTFAGMEGEWELYTIEGIESQHNYAHKSSLWWEVAYYGARSIKIHFSKVLLADSGDTVTLFDGNQVKLDLYTGKHPEGFWSMEIPGDRALLYFVTNSFSVDYGFNVDQVAVLR